MLSIANKVEQLVSESPFLTEGIAAGLINLSELARQLRPQLESDLWKPVGQAAVVMALRRISERLPQTGMAHSIVLAPRLGELTTRTDLMISTYRLSDTSNECQRELLALAEPYPGTFVTVTRGVHEVLVVCSRPLTHLVEEAFADERLLARVENLTALTLRLNPETRKTPGIYHAVLKKLAWDKISVVNMMCTFSELTILLEQSQTGAAFSVLSQIVGH
ncbi:hypothetical protein Q4S45_21005 [Massilia sp. R2A-15]|uniref:hypothetical protein n=1 Tax=Massilia sp. R2A-15 TaxID=3064278 RepID=UPI0027324A0D|nr:hypothetical protein [Massilia sp. R2A-15]WLI89145.1 hypothetical protein Q4S45_21005 [Massilia sp. R2A-15]